MKFKKVEVGVTTIRMSISLMPIGIPGHGSFLRQLVGVVAGSRVEGHTNRSAHAQATQCQNCELQQGTTNSCKCSSGKLWHSRTLGVEGRQRKIDSEAGVVTTEVSSRTHNQ